MFPPSSNISGLIGHLSSQLTDVELYGDKSPTSATGEKPENSPSSMVISFVYAPTVKAFHACPGFSTQCKIFALGYSAALNSVGLTLPALIKKSRLRPLPSAPDVILSTAPDHEVGLPSLVPYSDEVTAIHMARSA